MQRNDDTEQTRPGTQTKSQEGMTVQLLVQRAKLLSTMARLTKDPEHPVWHVGKSATCMKRLVISNVFVERSQKKICTQKSQPHHEAKQDI